VPPLDYIYGEAMIYDNDFKYQYFESMYQAVLMLGGNEIGPVSEIEKAFVALIMLAGNIINANIFGEMAVLV